MTQHLQKGGGHPANEVRDILQETAAMLGDTSQVWARFDNAYYRKDVVNFCKEHGWDYSISVTSNTYKRPLREMMEGFIEEDWEASQGKTGTGECIKGAADPSGPAPSAMRNIQC